MKRLLFLFLLASTAQAELIPILAGDDTFILPDVCLYSSTDGVAQVTIDSEDAGLEIRLTSDDGTTALVYDAAAEIETIVTNYTWSAPTALNVRLKVQTNGCHQLMFAAASLDNGTIWASLTIRDTSAPTFMDYDAKLMYVATSTTNQADVNAAMVALQLDHLFNQAVVGADVTDNSYAAYLVSKSATADFDSFDNETDAQEAVRDLLVVTDGKVDTAQLDLDDLTAAYILYTSTCDSGTNGTCVDATLTQAATDYWVGAAIVFTDNTDTIIDQTRCVTGFTPASDTLTFLPVTTTAVTTSTYSLVFGPTCPDIAAVKAETVLIVADTSELQVDDYPGLFTTAQADLDILTGTNGAFLDDDAITAAKIAADAIGASEIATDAIGAAEIATDAIGAGEIAADAITAAEVAAGTIDAATFAAGAIDASAIATDAIGAAEIAADAIGASEIAADAIGSSEIATAAIGALEIATDAIGAAEIAADAITAAEVADATIDAATFASGAINAAAIAVDAIGASELAADASAEIWAVVCEDQGATYTCREVLSLILAEGMGTAVYTSGTRTWVVKDPSGTETRITMLYGAELDGDRTTSTLVPMTP